MGLGRIDERSEVAVARVALSTGLLTQLQFDRWVARIRAGELDRPLEDALEGAGLIAPEQAATLRGVRGRLAPDQREDSSVMARQLLRAGLATDDEIAEAKRRQRVLEGEGRAVPLGEILVDMGTVSPDDTRRLVRRKPTTRMVCVVCQAEHQIESDRTEIARCPTCGLKLLFPDDIRAASDAAAPAAAGPNRPPAQEGDVVAGCRIEGTLGQGATARVFRARHLALGRGVALKMVPVTGRGAAAGRVLEEARVIAQIDHPSIVRLYGVEVHAGHLCLIEELVEGKTLDAVLKERGRLPVGEAVRIARHVARGLAAAHARGVLHRDVKPANILLSADGRAKVADFGLARRIQGDGSSVDSIAGSPAYMAPEAWSRRGVGPHSDLYSLGVVCYRMLTGRLPFEARNREEARRAHIEEAPAPIQSVQRSVPQRLAAVVMKCLEKKPARRYADARTFLDDLERFRKGETPRAAATAAGKVLCPFCEAPQAKDAGTCSICKTDLRPGPARIELAARPGEKPCPACREPMPATARACSRCGKAWCVQCRRREAVGGSLCRRCAGARS